MMLQSMLSFLAAPALIIVSLAPAAAHYVELHNACHHLQVTGKIADARWRGRTRPLVDGKTYTEGDTTAWLSSPMGTVTATITYNGSTIDTKLKLANAPGVAFSGFLGYDIEGGSDKDQTEAWCSDAKFDNCWQVQTFKNPQQLPAYAVLEFGCEKAAG